MKTLSLIFMLAGILLIILRVLNINLPIISNLNTLLAIVIGLILIAAGLLFLKSPGAKQPEEVPIYEGKGKKRKIVGYQRVK